MQNKNNKTDRLKNTGLGMFIHWSVYSVPWFGEWRMFVRKISPQEDINTYTCYFAADRFAPKDWAHRFKGTIMKYMAVMAQNTITALVCMKLQSRNGMSSTALTNNLLERFSESLSDTFSRKTSTATLNFLNKLSKCILLIQKRIRTH